MNEVPPKALKNAVSLVKMGQGALLRGSQLPTKIQLSKEDLPVLAAFQEFLELERRRTRNNVIALSLFFTFVLFASILSAYFVGSSLIRQMKIDFNGLQTDIRTTQSDTSSTLAKIKKDSEKLNNRIESQGEKMAVDLNKGLSGQMAEISSVKKTTGELQEENEKLRKELEDIRQALVAMTSKTSPQVNTEVRKALGTGISKYSDTYAKTRIISYNVTPAGSARKVNWMVPVILE